MLSILSSQKSIVNRKKNLFNSLYLNHGQQTVQQYSQQVVWITRQINRYFKDRFGVPLKSYCMILKCHAAFEHIKKGNLQPQPNYFDQFNFIKDSKLRYFLNDHLKNITIYKTIN
jgi:hypothetical protein